MTTLEEMVETFFSAVQRTEPHSSDRTMIHVGLLAVIEKHVGPMISAAYMAGEDDTDKSLKSGRLHADHFDYAARIIAQLKASTNDQ